jgi:hypothetical protein
MQNHGMNFARQLLTPDSAPGLPPITELSDSAKPTGEADANFSAPEIPIQPAPKNDAPATVENSGKGGLGEAIRNATATITNAATGIFKKSRGRYRKCRQCDGKPGNEQCPDCKGTGKLPNKNDAPGVVEEIVGEIAESENSASVDLPPAGPAASAGDSQGGNRFRRSVSSSVKSLFAILGSVVAGYADAAKLDPDFTDAALKKAMPAEKDIEAFNDDLDAVLRKRGVEPKNSEEWALAINGLKMAAPLAVLVFEFRRELRRQREEGNKK